MKARIATILRYFPTWSETFVYREITALRQQGVVLFVYCWRNRRTPELLQQSTLGSLPAFPPLIELPRFPLYFPMILASFYELVRQPRSVVSAWRWLSQQLKWRDGLKALWMAWHLKKHGVSALHVHFAGEAAEIAEMVRRIAGIPYVITLHARDLFVPRPSFLTVVNNASTLICISEFNRQFLLQRYGQQLDARVRVIRLGVPVETFESALDAWSPADAHSFPLLAISRLVEKKGLVYLIEAVSLLRERGVPATLSVVGEGQQRALLAREMRAHGVEKVVTLLGTQTQQQIEALFQSGVAVFVQPAVIASDGDMDGIPVALMEAMARQVAVVTTPVSGIPELVIDGVNGLMVATGSAMALADGLERLYRDDDLRRRLALAGRARVEKDFSLTQSALAVSAVLDAVAGE